MMTISNNSSVQSSKRLIRSWRLNMWVDWRSVSWQLKTFWSSLTKQNSMSVDLSSWDSHLIHSILTLRQLCLKSSQILSRFWPYSMINWLRIAFEWSKPIQLDFTRLIQFVTPSNNVSLCSMVKRQPIYQLRVVSSWSICVRETRSMSRICTIWLSLSSDHYRFGATRAKIERLSSANFNVCQLSIRSLNQLLSHTSQTIECDLRRFLFQ